MGYADMPDDLLADFIAGPDGLDDLNTGATGVANGFGADIHGATITRSAGTCISTIPIMGSTTPLSETPFENKRKIHS